MKLHELVLKGLEEQVLGLAFGFYECNGQILFRSFGASGGISTGHSFWIITRHHDKHFTYCYGMILPESFSLDRLEITLKRALVTFVWQLADGTAKRVDLEGGELPKPDLPTSE